MELNHTSYKGKLHLWQFWMGPMPGYVKVATDLMRRLHAPNYTLLGEADLATYGIRVEEFPYIAQAVDLLRARVIHRRGGLYVDADCIPRTNLLSVVDSTLRDGATAGCVLEWARDNTLEKPTGLQCSFSFAAKPGHPFFERCALEIVKAHSAGRVGWTDTNAVINNVSFAEMPRAAKDTFAVIDWRNLAPIPSAEWGLYAARGNDRVLSSILQNPEWQRCWALMLYNAMMCSELGHMPPEVFLKSDCLIAEVCRQLLASIGEAPDTAYDISADCREIS